MLYAATYEGGVFRTTTAAVDGSFEPVAGSPGSVEELALVDGTLYAAAGALGLFSYSPLTGGWQRLDSALVSPAKPVWTSIAGYAACGSTVIYAGSDAPGSNVVVRSEDAGQTWSGLGAGAVHVEVGGPGGHRWWLASRPSFLLTGKFYLSSQLAVGPATPADPCRRANVITTGRSGLWGSADAGGTWYPYVGRLGTTVTTAVAADPANPGRVLAATLDWSALGSTHGLETVVQQQPGVIGGAAVTFGTSGTSSTAYLATGDQNANVDGEVYANGAFAGGGSWQSQRLAAVAGGRRPVAVSARTVNGTTVLLAAVQGSGLWRRTGTTWRHVSTVAAANRSMTLRASFAWSAASSVAFLYDNKSGLWRSTNAGLTWQRVWSRISAPQSSGYVAADPGIPGRIYVSAGGRGLYRLDRATTGNVDGGTLVAVQVVGSPLVGPVAVGDNGAVVVAVTADAGRADGTPARLLRSADGGATWVDIADATYRQSGGFATGIAIGSDRWLYVALRGDGVITGIPSS